MNFFTTGLKIEFQKSDLSDSVFLQEYLNLNANKTLAKWKKLSSRTDFSEGERLVFDLLLELKSDIVSLKQSNEEKSLLELGQKGFICAMNFECLKFSEELLESGSEYYARFDLNSQKIAVFLKALDANTAKIIKIKSDDESVYSAFVVEIQRDMIKNLKGKDEQ
ncbi:hypothetical protein [Campylobacter sp. US33a]|nr:hypothetical protein [Campylobacter sp. US33a]